MNEKELGAIKGWFTGRLPDGWFTGVEVAVEDDQIVVIGNLPEINVGSTPEEKEGAAAGRIARFREETRGNRIGIAQEAEERFKKYVTWGAQVGGGASLTAEYMLPSQRLGTVRRSRVPVKPARAAIVSHR